MDPRTIIARLREHEAELRSRGVLHAALFGSRARGEEGPESDTDIMIEIDPTAGLTLFDYAGLKEDIASLFEGPVDVVNRHSLKSSVKPAAIADAVYAF
jgi:predicted nucleotidyltransferase